jgi:hypothetical protein
MGTNVRSAVLMVTVAEAGPPPTGTGLGEAAHAAPRGKVLPTQLRVTDCENPVPGVIVIGKVTDWPAVTVALGWVVEIVKLEFCCGVVLPVKLITTGKNELLIVITALRIPSAVGVNVTSIAQRLSAANDVMQLATSVIAKSPAWGPDITMLVIVTGVSPSVIVRV